MDWWEMQVEGLLCNAFIDFLIVRDTSARLKFAALQGQTASQKQIPKDLSTVVFEHGERLFFESSVFKNLNPFTGFTSR